MKINKFKVAQFFSGAVMRAAESLCDLSCAIINTQLGDKQKVTRNDVHLSDIRREEYEAYHKGYENGQEYQRTLDKHLSRSSWHEGYINALEDIRETILCEIGGRLDAHLEQAKEITMELMNLAAEKEKELKEKEK